MLGRVCSVGEGGEGGENSGGLWCEENRRGRWWVKKNFVGDGG